LPTNAHPTAVESTDNQTHTLDLFDVEHDPSARDACAECGGNLVTANDETFCEDCGLILATEFLDRGPTLVDLGVKGTHPVRSLETDNPFASGKSHGSVIWGSTDYNGNPVPKRKKRRLARMKKWQKRYAYSGNRDREARLDDVFNDIELLRGQLALPQYVAVDAADYLRMAKAARLPGGRMAWESLAAGAVLVACQADGVPRSPREVARYSKTSHERLCAAARKIRVELDLDVPPVRQEPVQAVLDALPDSALDGVQYVRLSLVGRHILDIADKEHIAPGTSRIAAASAAIRAALRLHHHQWVHIPDLVEAASTIVDQPTSGSISAYACEMYDAYVERHGVDSPEPVIEASPIQVPA